MVTNPDWNLDPNSSIPLHIQFEALIRKRIESGDWQQGDQIPSERDLMQLAGISRATVRQTLTTLVFEGILEKSHGRGTFVKRTRFEQPLESVYSFSEQLRAGGVILEDLVLDQRTIPASDELAARLRIKVGESLILLKRLRSIHETPVMVSVAYIPEMFCPNLMHDTLEGSLYSALTARYGIPILNATDTLESVAADAVTARLLRVPGRTPLMYVERLAYTTGDRPLHWGQNYIRGDMCRFRTHMSQPNALELKYVSE